MHIEGPDGITSDIDFSGWSWGQFNLDSGLLKVIADRVAEVIWNEAVESFTKERYARFTWDERTNQPAIGISLFEHFIVLPLGEITIDDDLAAEGDQDEDVPRFLRQWADDIEQRRKR